MRVRAEVTVWGSLCRYTFGVQCAGICLGFIVPVCVWGSVEVCICLRVRWGEGICLDGQMGGDMFESRSREYTFEYVLRVR